MNDFVKNLQKIERSLSAEEGMFNLFALFLLEERSAGKWDLLVAAPWTERNKGDALKRVCKKVQKLSMKDLLKLSRVIIIDQDNPGLADLQRAVQVEHGDIELRDRNFFELDVRHAHVITCRRTEVARKAARARRNDSAKRGRDSRTPRPLPAGGSGGSGKRPRVRPSGTRASARA